MAQPSSMCRPLARLALAAAAKRIILPASQPFSTQVARLSSTQKTAENKILSQSEILLQDGLQILEHPLVIRRMSATEFPFTNIRYTGSKLRRISEEEDHFKMQLQSCQNLHEVFNLLEVPGDQVSCYAAAFALQRLSQLKEGTIQSVDSFIRQAIFNELCDTATKNIDTLECDTLIGLTRCYLRSDVYQQVYVERINDEVQRRIGDRKFSVEQICDLIQLLCEAPKGDQELVNHLWIHLWARYKDINESNLAQVYAILRNITPQHKHLLQFLDRSTQKCWWKLTPSDITAVMKGMNLTNHGSYLVLRDLGKWVFMNIHDVKDLQLKDILATYTRFSFPDVNLVRGLERYVTAKIRHMDKSVVAMVMDYCYQCKLLSTRIFDCVANDYAENPSEYDAHHMFYLLRPYGYLNYIPPNATALFQAIEDSMQEKFGQFWPHQVVELLTTFVYLCRFPQNFINNVFNPHFLAKIHTLQDGSVKVKAGQQLKLLYTAARLEMPGAKPIYMDRAVLTGSSSYLGGRQLRFHQELGKMLTAHIPAACIRSAKILKNTPYFVDFEILLGLNSLPLPALGTKPSVTSVSKKLAFVTVMPEHMCVNTQHLLGQYAMRTRHLQRIGYTVIEVYYDQFMWHKDGEEGRTRYVQNVLRQYGVKKNTNNS